MSETVSRFIFDMARLFDTDRIRHGPMEVTVRALSINMYTSGGREEAP